MTYFLKEKFAKSKKYDQFPATLTAQQYQRATPEQQKLYASPSMADEQRTLRAEKEKFRRAIRTDPHDVW